MPKIEKRKISNDEGSVPEKKVKTEKPKFSKKLKPKENKSKNVKFNSKSEPSNDVSNDKTQKESNNSKGVAKVPKVFKKSANAHTGKSFDKKGQFGKGKNFNKQTDVKPTDWVEFKKKKKELKSKRRQGKALYDDMVQPKQLAEKIRCKSTPSEERVKLIDKLHEKVKGKELYAKFVMTHDMARIVQVLLKFGTLEIREEIAKELLPVTVQMLESKYGKFCVKRLLKYGDSKIRSSVIRATYGNVVKLSSHAISAPIFEYAYSTWASQQEKSHLYQEFFGDMYKHSKDDKIKHLRDVYENSPDMKSAALGATKSNLSRILNKDLLDSALVQTVLCQYLAECSTEDRTEFISQLSPHVVILSNSKDGARVAMNCVWHGNNKDKKVAMKAVKEHVLDLSKHEHGHCTVITMLDATDDTVLLNKLLLGEIIKHALELSKNEWGRKVLLWIVAPGDSAHFHPFLIKELDAGRTNSTCKKAVDIRRKEISGYSINNLLETVSTSPKDWLSSGSIGILTLAMLKSGNGEPLKKAFESVSDLIVDPTWTIKENEKEEICGVEHSGLHMILKKLAQHDKVVAENGEATFGEVLLEKLNAEVISRWVTMNRGCFLLVAIFENGTANTQKALKEKLCRHLNLLKKQTSSGAKILLKKIE